MRQKTEVFSDDETEDRSSRINSEVYRDILSAQIQSKAAKLIGWCFIVQMEMTQNATQEFLKVKKQNIQSQSPDLNPIEQHFTRWRQN